MYQLNIFAQVQSKSWGFHRKRFKKSTRVSYMLHRQVFSGHTGPLKDAPAYDTIITAISGIMMETGYPDAPPVRVSSLPDYVAVSIYSVE